MSVNGVARRIGWAGGTALALFLTQAIAAGAKTSNAAPGDWRTAVMAATRAYDAGRCEEALPALRNLADDPAFREAPEKLLLLIWDIGVDCAARANIPEEAFRYAVLETNHVGASKLSWLVRTQAALMLFSTEAVFDAIASIPPEDAESMNEIDSATFIAFSEHLHAQRLDALQTRLFEALDRRNYTPKNPYDWTDALWLSYAGLLVKKGDLSRAADVMGRVDHPYFLATVGMDRLFRQIVAKNPAHFDPRTSAVRQLARDQAGMAAHPELARGVSEAALNLRLLGRPAEALELLEKAVDRVRSSPAAKPAYIDLDTRRNWLDNDRASTLRDLGRFDEWVAGLRAASKLPEDGAANVSQVINLAEALVDMDRPEEALNELAVFGVHGEGRPASPYGVMEMMATRACAFAELARTTDLQATISYMRDHESDNPAAVTDALVCADDLDAAAASLARRLADPQLRYRALWEIADFTDQPPRTPHMRVIEERRGALRERPDVAKAIAAVADLRPIALRQGVF